jgi:uncharacterized repeat protein (TIGR03803 family)
MNLKRQSGLLAGLAGSILISACGSGSSTSGTSTTPITPPTNVATLTTLHAFGGTSGDALSPNSALIKGSDGNFYGVSYSGGANGTGALFKMTPAGVESVLYSFGAYVGDGTQPGSVMQGTDGNFYGTTVTGGVNGSGSCAAVTVSCVPGDGTIFKVTPAGAETVLYSFGNTSTDGINPNGNMIQASDGNFYGTTGAGGANSNGAVFKVSTSGIETLLYSFGAGSTTDAKSPAAGLIQLGSGNLYGTTTLGGINGKGTVFQITTGGIESVLYSFGSSGTDGITPYAALTQGTDGNLYGTTIFGGANNLGSVFKVTPVGAESIVYSFGSSSKDGTLPYDSVIQGSDGNFYGTTYSGGSNGASLCTGITTTCYPGYGTVFMITPAGVETVLYSFGTTTADGLYPAGGLMLSGSTFYGATTSGGTYGGGTLYSLVN